MKTGQRWISTMEPELGLGTVTEAGDRKVTIHFPASECHRQYAIQSAPLQRVRFQIGDTVKGQKGEQFRVQHVVEKEGLIIYSGDDIDLVESDLCDSISFTTPQSRLMNGLGDTNAEFNLRYETLLNQWKIRKSEMQGFMGGRIDLIPHQIYIAREVSSRYLPRVLLADEVGLGKTIEACLILHRLLIRERINRVLILVPESLVHQWFIELLRRFHLIFRILDEPYCQSVEKAHSEINPFQEEQWVLCSIDFLSLNEKRNRQAVMGHWDMIVVDEAHHLTRESPKYRLVETLGMRTDGMMLLTATPEQLGRHGHFERLRLLDPARYHDFHSFEKEAEQYHRVAKIADALSADLALNHDDGQFLSAFLSRSGNSIELPKFSREKSDGIGKQILMEELLDRYGPGRVMFRNTRSRITGFPDRIVRLVGLSPSAENKSHFQEVFKAEHTDSENEIHYNFMKDPRIDWLAGLLQKLKGQKVLLICRSPAKVKAIDEALRDRIKLRIGLFHENLTLIQRDRNAAWFGEKDGAQILICSEIGSEGRNFQFAHHLVLFDLPLNPEKLEQRIGRLDRIGQTQAITIYIPYVPGTPQEVLVRWYHEGLNAFTQNVPGVFQLYEKMGTQVKDIAFAYTGSDGTTEVDRLIEATRAIRDRFVEFTRQGRDRLLELNSFKPHDVAGFIDEMKQMDGDTVLKTYLTRLFHHFGIKIEEMDHLTFGLDFHMLSNPEFPMPPLQDDLVIATFDRKKALSREDMAFLTWDHPMVIGAMELIIGSEKGNSCFATYLGDGAREILLEVIYILECVAPSKLQVNRFLPATPIRIVINQDLEDRTDVYPFHVFEESLRENLPVKQLDHSEFTQTVLPRALERSRDIAETEASGIIYGCLDDMHTTLGKEIRRLEVLKAKNPHVRNEEISLFKAEKDSLHDYMAKARLRLDALRLVLKGSPNLPV